MSENNQYIYETVSDEPVAKVSTAGRVKGIIGMILGILSIAGGVGANLLFPIAGLILSSMAAKDGETKFSKIGRITSILGLIVSIIGFIVWVVVVAVGVIANM